MKHKKKNEVQNRMGVYVFIKYLHNNLNLNFLFDID